MKISNNNRKKIKKKIRKKQPNDSVTETSLFTLHLRVAKQKEKSSPYDWTWPT